MNSEFGGNTEVCGPIMTNMKALGKRSLEWDLNDWRWDGDLFVATPLNPPPLECRGRQLFPLIPEHSVITNVSNSCSYGSEFMNTSHEIETRRGVNPDLDLNNEAGSLNLKLGERAYGVVEGEDDKMEGKSVKKSKPNGPNGPVGPVCQVEGCRADLRMGKDYHRRHRVCEVHSKVSEALVGNVVQRFCQQCSRFHPLEKFDEGKRSCRQRLAGHNKRRRKTQPETTLTNPSSLPDEKNAAFLLVSLLKLLSRMHRNNSDNSKDQDQISHLLRSLGGQVDGINIPDLQRASHSLLNGGSSVGTPEKNLLRVQEPFQAAPLMRENQYETQRTLTMFQEGNMQKADLERDRLSGIDLNSVYIDLEECVDISDGSYIHTPEQYLLKSSPPQTSGTSDSISGHYSSSGSGSGSETRGFTDRIVFKLFGKDPNDLPHLLRAQLVDWLSKTPTDIEGYIRPGCIVLTIYLRLNKALWEELCFDLTSSLTRLLSVSDDSVWKTGWIYTRVRQRAAFICDGQVVLDTPLPLKSHQIRISSISPIAVPAAQTVEIVVKGSNLFGTTSRVLCAIEGKYLVQESCALEENTDGDGEDDIQSISFCCAIPDVVGRGFIEVEDQGLSGCFFPFIVAEPDICSEICMLQKLIDVDETNEGIDGEYNTINTKNNALDFIHEIGWLLRRDRLSKWGPSDLHLDRFSFDRLKWLIEFSMDRDWCAVLKKLLDFLFSGTNTIDIGDHISVELALSEMALLHTAVQRNSRPLVDFLLRYRPIVAQYKLGQEKQSDDGLVSGFIFRPDTAGSNGLTPLHVAASCEGFENVLDALLEDPGMVGMKAWENAQDSTGLTPKDYALLRGHNNYITLFQKKMDKNSSGEHVVVDILAFSNLESKQKQVAKFNNVFYTEKSQPSSCNMCVRKAGYGFRGTGLACKPAMLSLVAIAVVCVCTALLFKSMPRVCYVFGPFRWELLKYGAV